MQGCGDPEPPLHDFTSWSHNKPFQRLLQPPVHVFPGLPACPPATGKFYVLQASWSLLPPPAISHPSFAHFCEWGGQLLANACSFPFSSGHSQSASRPGKYMFLLSPLSPHCCICESWHRLLQQPAPLFLPPQLVTVLFPKCTSSPRCKTHSFA